MKKISSIICLLLVVLCSTFAQGNKDKQQIREKVKAQRIAFITTKLNLTAKEAQGFWPLYNRYQEDKKAIQNTYYQPDRPIDELTEKEAEQFLEENMKMMFDLLVLRKDFLQSSKSVLPKKKVAKFVRVENKFKKWMLQQTRTGKRG